MTTCAKATLGAVAAALALVQASPASANCRVTGTPVDILSDGWKLAMEGGPMALAVFDDGKALLMGGNTSWGLMSLASPGAPVEVAHGNLADLVPCAEDCSVLDIAGTADGDYFLVGSTGWDLGTLAFKRVAGSYSPVGRFDVDPTLVVAHSSNGRHLGVSLSLMTLATVAVDLDTATGSLGSAMTTEAFPGSVFRFGGGATSTGPYVVLDTYLTSGVEVVYAKDIGAAVPNLTASFIKVSVTPQMMGVVQDETLVSVAAAVDPADTSDKPRLFIFTSHKSISTNRLTFRLGQLVGASTYTALGSYSPPGQFGDATNSIGQPVGAVAVGTDVAFFAWGGDGDSAAGAPPTVLRLYSFMASNFPTVDYSDFDRATTLEVVSFERFVADGQTVYGYFSTGDTLVAVSLSCAPGQLSDAGIITNPSDASVVEPPDAGCVGGAACTASDGCKAGKITCPGATCGSLTNVADGTACLSGAGKCVAGACVVCSEGAACDGPDVCTAGTWSCSPAPTCANVAPKADGASCGTGKVCYQAMCVNCVSGGKCTSVDGCKHGTTTCTTGQPSCDETTYQNEIDGTLCSGTGKCKDGVCSSCTDGAKCMSENGCQQGTVSCNGGATCYGLKDVADGTACKGGTCKAGACVSCIAGLPCESADGCATGTTNCNTGSVKCGNLMFKTNGTPCSGGVCSNGLCKVPPDAGPLLPPDAASPKSDAAVAGLDAGASTKVDAGHGAAKPSGCGCHSSLGSAWSAWVLLTGAMFLRRRRK